MNKKNLVCQFDARIICIQVGMFYSIFIQIYSQKLGIDHSDKVNI